MARITVGLGLLLTLLGIGAYLYTRGTSITALLPAVVGVILLICGGIALSRPELNRTVMHVAVAVALLAALGSLRVFTLLGDPDAPQTAIVSQLAMLVLCGGYVALGVRSFIQARRARTA
jgi:hypothetical protein